MNKDILSKVLLFAAGAIVGSVVTYKLTKAKYEQDEYEDYYEEEKEPDISESETKEVEQTLTASVKDTVKEDMVRYHKIVKRSGYAEESDVTEKKEGKDVDRPYAITPDEFAELDGYRTETLYYYADGILADEDDNIIEDVDDIVGEENLTTFEEDKRFDSIYIRNDACKTDYEILRDLDCYSDKYHVEV